MMHPLKIAEGYVLMKDRVEPPKPRVRNKNPTPKKDMQKVYLNQKLAKKYGEPKTYFYPYTAPKRTRAFLILGAGDIEKGYLKYLTLKGKVLNTFKKAMTTIRQNRLASAFSKFMDYDIGYLSTVIKRINTKGISSYEALLSTHNINKQYIKFEKEYNEQTRRIKR